MVPNSKRPPNSQVGPVCGNLYVIGGHSSFIVQLGWMVRTGHQHNTTICPACPPRRPLFLPQCGVCEIKFLSLCSRGDLQHVCGWSIPAAIGCDIYSMDGKVKNRNSVKMTDNTGIEFWILRSRSNMIGVYANTQERLQLAKSDLHIGYM